MTTIDPAKVAEFARLTARLQESVRALLMTRRGTKRVRAALRDLDEFTEAASLAKMDAALAEFADTTRAAMRR